MATRANDTRRTPPVDLGSAILARMLPARELAEALAAEPLETVEPFLEDLKKSATRTRCPIFPWAPGAACRGISGPDESRKARSKVCTEAGNDRNEDEAGTATEAVNGRPVNAMEDER